MSKPTAMQLRMELDRVNEDINKALEDGDTAKAEPLKKRARELSGHTDETGQVVPGLIEKAWATETAEREQRELEVRMNGGTPETRAEDKLVGQFSVGRLAHSVIEQRSIDGAEREAQKHFNLAGNQIPVAVLRSAMQTREPSNPGRLQTRDVTPAPAEVGAVQSPIIDYVFPDGDAAFLMAAQPMVPVGEHVYTALSTPAAAGLPAKGAPQAETTGAFTAVSKKPSRAQASFFYDGDDAAVLAGMDAALVTSLGGAVQSRLDEEVVARLLAEGKAVDASANIVDWAAWNGQLYGAVDGRYAPDTMQTRVLAGLATYQRFGGLYRTNESDRSAVEHTRTITGGLRASAHVAAPANSKQKAIVRLGSRMDAVTAIWEGATLIRDEVTKAAEGQIVLTMVLRFAHFTIRPEAFRIVNLKVSA